MAKSSLIPQILLLLLFSSQLDPSKASSVPSKLDGFAYNGSGPWKDSVLIEAFFDPVCPDSRDSWPPLKKVVEQFSPRVSLIVHPFPLPFHNNAYLACRALHIANKLNSSSTYDLLELFFKYQEKYYNGPTASGSRIAIQKDMSKLGAFALGNSFLADFENGFQDSSTDAAARISYRELGSHELRIGVPNKEQELGTGLFSVLQFWRTTNKGCELDLVPSSLFLWVTSKHKQGYHFSTTVFLYFSSICSFMADSNSASIDY